MLFLNLICVRSIFSMLLLWLSKRDSMFDHLAVFSSLSFRIESYVNRDCFVGI